jgi:prepilin-type N-terminal cleavage/methylation domain-containing protein/prepilin-type processing-associated H-X9-DG protein
MNRGGTRRKGFSLIELLIVITVIAVLAAILFPTFAAAKRRSRAAACESNLRQIYAAFELYLQDWDECYPNTGDPYLWMGRKWRWVLQDHLNFSAHQSPGDPLKSSGNRPGPLLCPDDAAAPAQWDGTSYSYSMSFYLSPGRINAMTAIQQTWTDRPPCETCRKGDVVYSSQKVLLTEWLSNHELPHVGFGSWEGARNYLFADGH